MDKNTEKPKGTYHSFYFPDGSVYEGLKEISEQIPGESASSIIFEVSSNFVKKFQEHKAKGKTKEFIDEYLKKKAS